MVTRLPAERSDFVTQATGVVLTILDHKPRLRVETAVSWRGGVTVSGACEDHVRVVAPVGTMPMEAWGNKTRFSVAAFRALQDLEAAVSGLIEIGFEAPQIGLAAIRSRLAELERPIAGGAPNGLWSTGLLSLSDFFGLFDVTEAMIDGEFVVVNHGSTWQAVGCFDAHANDAADGDAGISYASRAKMLDQLGSGVWLLGANARSFAQLRAGTRLLLAHSCDRVETFELHAG